MRVPTRLFLICSVFLLASLTLFFTTIHVTAQDFLSAKIISPSELPVWAGILASGDLNGDGIPDVVYSVPQTTTSGYYSSIGVAFGSTSGLHPAGVYSQAPYTVLIADVNGDGKPDIVGGVNVGATADLLIYLNQGDGTFAAPLISQITTNNSLWPRVMGIGVGDFDGDGKADVVISDQNGNFFCLHGSGSGTFTLTSQFQQHLISSYRIAQVADLNHDGKLDLVVALVEGATVGVMLGNGNGTFQPLTLLPVYTYWPVVADFNGDGIPDIATTTLILNNGAITSYAAVIYAGNGDGTFRQLNTFPFSSAYGTLLAARDVNGDGELDLIFDGANGFTVCLGQGGGNFGAPVTYSVPRWMNGGAAVGDFNGDGYTDIVGAENYSDPMVYSLRGFPGGTFEGATSLDVPSQPNMIATADLNGDHVPDIAVSEESGTTVLLSNGDGTFRSISDSLILGDQIFLADLDGDTIPDELFVPSSPYSNVSYRHGYGDGTFATPVTGIALYHGASAVSLGDLNLDGDPDLVGIHDGSLPFG